MSARFPVENLATALALHTAGYPIAPDEKYHEHDGTRHRTWWINHRAAEAQGLVTAFHDPQAAQNLQTTEPVHPFLAARWAIEAIETLSGWLSGISGPPALARTAGPLVRAVPAGSIPENCDWQTVIWGTGVQPAVRVDEMAYAAALIVCGFPVYPRLIPPGAGQGPAFAFPAESLTFPGLRQDLLCQIVNEQRQGIRVTPLPGFSMGEHPFDYAFQGALNVPHVEAAAAPASKNPTIFLKGPGSGGVLASASLLEESHPLSQFRDEAFKFLS